MRIFNVNNWKFDHIEDKDTSYLGKDCMKKVCINLSEYAKNINDFEKNKVLPLLIEELKSQQDARVCYICGKKIWKKFSENLNYRKIRDHCHYTGIYTGATHSICNLKFNVLHEIPVIFHNISNYVYHFITKELANELEIVFECFRKNIVKNKTFSVPIEKEITKIDRDANGNLGTISYKIKFIDSVKFVVSLLWNLVDSLSEEIHKINCKDCDCFLECKSLKGNSIKWKGLSCKKDYSKKLD